MGLFKKKKETDGLIKATMSASDSDEGAVMNEVIQIMANDGVNICAEACACCWDTKIPDGYAERAEYISKRTRIGHGSVTEHSNHVYYMEISDEDIVDLTEFLSSYTEYVHTVYRHSKQYSKGYLIIGGSWRAFRDIIIKSPSIEDNSIVVRLMSMIYKTINSAGMADLVKNKAIEDGFMNIDNKNALIFAKATHVELENLEVVNIDDFEFMLNNIKGICPEPELFTMYDLLDMCTITVLFKNMSRIITQQLTRHRNAITQESQRYVDYSKGMFNSPAKFKENYDPNYQYTIQFGRSSQKMTLQEIGDNIVKIYGQLYDKEKTANHALVKEDARAYLPNNTRCNKIYITFTWRSFFSFLQLREDTHAQAEIHQYAVTLGTWFRELYPDFTDLYDAIEGYRSDTDKYYMGLGDEDPNKVDEVLSEEEVISQMEDYAKNSVEGEPFTPTEGVKDDQEA